MIPDATLGGYLAKHDRPPAFEGLDGAAYSVEVYIDERTGEAPRFAAALLFVRWSRDGAQPVGHLETEYLATGERRRDVRQVLHDLSLHEVKTHLDRLTKTQPEWPDS